jgi:hypothetical protein
LELDTSIEEIKMVAFIHGLTSYTVKPIYGTSHVKYSENSFTDYIHGTFRVFDCLKSRVLATELSVFFASYDPDLAARQLFNCLMFDQ